jgi:predicted ester cyclase
MEARDLVRSFYADVISQTRAADLTERMARFLSPSWESLGDYSGQKKSREQFGAQLAGFGKLIPDLSWKVEEVLGDGGRVVVRSRASGTPQGELFGVPPSGRKFEILAIDIHTVEGSHIVRTWHVEDWAGALAQLSGR